jgi:hypothetical protein
MQTVNAFLHLCHWEVFFLKEKGRDRIHHFPTAPVRLASNQMPFPKAQVRTHCALSPEEMTTRLEGSPSLSESARVEISSFP